MRGCTRWYGLDGRIAKPLFRGYGTGCRGTQRYPVLQSSSPPSPTTETHRTPAPERGFFGSWGANGKAGPLPNQSIHEMGSSIQKVDKATTPSLLPIFRSRQQAEVLALLLGDPQLELSLTDLASRLGVPYPSVHREIERAETAGLVVSHKIGNTRLVRANTSSPYFEGLSQVLVRAFGVPAVLADALRSVEGVERALVFGSWAARSEGLDGDRPVQDIDLLVLGAPDRDDLYEAIGEIEPRLGRPVQITIREGDWLERGSGSFHETVTGRPMVRLDLADDPPSVVE